jgi:hypothetical protein
LAQTTWQVLVNKPMDTIKKAGDAVADIADDRWKSWNSTAEQRVKDKQKAQEPKPPGPTPAPNPGPTPAPGPTPPGGGVPVDPKGIYIFLAVSDNPPGNVWTNKETGLPKLVPFGEDP